MTSNETPADRLERIGGDLVVEALNLLVRKTHDYTSGDGDPFANARGAANLGINPVTGILLRMSDKLQRVRTFVERGELRVRDEGVRDAALDLINYAVMAYALATEGAKENTNKDSFVTFWQSAPIWAKYWARDKDGEKYYFKTEPEINRANKWGAGGDGGQDMPTTDEHAPGVDWSESLRARPA